MGQGGRGGKREAPKIGGPVDRDHWEALVKSGAKRAQVNFGVVCWGGFGNGQKRVSLDPRPMMTVPNPLIALIPKPPWALFSQVRGTGPSRGARSLEPLFAPLPDPPLNATGEQQFHQLPV